MLYSTKRLFFGPLLLFVLMLFVVIPKAQTFDPYIQEKVEQLSYDSMYTKLQIFEELGIKEVGTEALDLTASWIIDQYQQYGYNNIEIDSFYQWQNLVYNIIVTKTGTTYPDTYLIVDGHYDTENGPGVNDNGSGTAIVLEVARMMANVETAYSIKFIHFTIEELGLIGSSHYVENTVIPEDMDIRLVFNNDEVGGVAGEVNNTITCERDESSPTSNNAASAAFTDTLASLTEMYSNLNTQISYAYGSDYVPFMLNGYVVTGLYETNESPYPHTINDNLSNLDPEYVFEVTKASLAATLYFSNYFDTSTGLALSNSKDGDFQVSPNPFISSFKIENALDKPVYFKLYDMTGRLVFYTSINTRALQTLSPNINRGFYIFKVVSFEGEVLDGGKVVKK